MPSDDGFWLDEYERGFPRGKPFRQQDPELPERGGEMWFSHFAIYDFLLYDRQLTAECDDLKVFLKR